MFIHRSVSKLLLLTIGCAAFVAVCVWIVTKDPSTLNRPSAHPMAWFGIVFFGLGLFVLAHRLIFGPRIPIELSPHGYVDRRLFKNEVSWIAVRGVHIWSYKGGSLLALQLTSEAMKGLEKTAFGKTKTWLNSPFGKNIVYLAIADLDIQADHLLRIFRQYIQKYNPASSGEH